MKFVLSILGACLFLAPALAHACPYASGSSGCGESGSLMSYAAWLVAGLGIGVTSVAFEKR